MPRDLVRDLPHERDERRRAVVRRVAREEAVHVGEDDENVRPHLAHDERGEPVVVAEETARPLAFGLQLQRRDRVVLVQDRHGIQLEELLERRREILETRPVREVVFREEDLRREKAHLLESLFVHGHQAALPDRGAGLLERERARLPAQAQPLRSEPHGA